MLMPRSGYTLLELMVVVVILGVLVRIALPQWKRSMENSKAELAATTVRSVAAANRMYYVDKNAYTQGLISNSCTSHSPCPTGLIDNPCNLISCGYLSGDAWNNQPYMIFAGNGSQGSPTCGDGPGLPGIAGMNPANVVACARRRKTTDSGSGGTADATYQAWGYALDSGDIFRAADGFTPGTLGGAPTPAQ